MSCLYSRHACRRERLPPFEYCPRHILEDKTAPFKPCVFQVANNRRCLRPAPKADKKDGFCPDHARRALLSRQRAGVLGRKRPAQLVQRCLQDLDHYKPEKLLKKDTTVAAAGPSTSGAAATPTPTPKREPDVEKDAIDVLSDDVIPSVSHRALEPCESDKPDNDESGGEEDTPVEELWRGDGDSDADSVDSDLEDPLKHAGAYSAEEVIRIMRDKLIRLQKLYIDQFGRLQFLLREERRAFRQRVRREKEDKMVSVHSQPKDTPEEVEAYEAVKSLGHYNRPQGLEAVLQAQLMEKRVRASEGDSFKPPAGAKCTHNLTTSTKCGESCIPMSKYCVKHILEDEKQVLFRQCHFTTEADPPCETPIPDMLEGATCVYHTQFSASLFDDKELTQAAIEEEVKVDKKEEDPDEPPTVPVVPTLPTSSVTPTLSTS